MPDSHRQLCQPEVIFRIPFAMFFPGRLIVFQRIGLTTKQGNRDLSLSQSEIQRINEIYADVEMAVDALESSKPWLNEFARKIASGEAHVPGPLLLFFRIAADPLPGLLSPDSFEDWASAQDNREKEFTAQTLHSEPEWSGTSVRSLERYFAHLRRSGAVLLRTKGFWGKRGSRPSDYGRPSYHYHLNPLSSVSLNPLSKAPEAINNQVEKIDRDFLSIAEKYLTCLPAYRELLARALSVLLELASNPDFLAVFWQVPEFKGLFGEIDVGMVERWGKQLSLIVPTELVPRLLLDSGFRWSVIFCLGRKRSAFVWE
jgi:hypothetical protein